jgi:hypothetical protein
MEAVRKLLPCPHIYYVGSHEGCSCAFNYEHELQSVVELRDYLRKALTLADEIEGFSCRPGGEQLNVKHSVVISPSGVALPEFFLQDGQRLVFRSRKMMQARRRGPVDAVPLKRKATEKLQAPRSKLQRSSKNQAPNKGYRAV